MSCKKKHLEWKHLGFQFPTHTPCRTGESGTTDPAGQRGKDQSPRAWVPKHIKRKEQRKTNEIGGRIISAAEKHRKKRLGREKSREGLCGRVSSLSLSWLYLLCSSPTALGFLSLLWCLTSEWPVGSKVHASSGSTSTLLHTASFLGVSLQNIITP